MLQLESQPGGILRLRKKEVLIDSKRKFDVFCKSRHSIRNFTNKDVNIGDIHKAVKLAQTAPSACNRQSSRIYLVTKKDVVNQLLKLQGGCRGFGHLANKAIVITSNIQVYQGRKERNLSCVDGGIFAMNLLYALHYYGLGACPLMCGENSRRTRQVRDWLHIPIHERIIMLVAVGHIPRECNVPESKRLPTDEIFRLCK